MATNTTTSKKTPEKSVAALEKELKATLAKLAKAKAQEKEKAKAKAKPAAKKTAAKSVKAKASNSKTAKPAKKPAAVKSTKKAAPRLSKQDEVRLLLAPRKATSKCEYCGSTKFGPGCPSSINKLHKHNTNEKRCMYCGKSAYGFGCLGTPTRRHVHGSGGGKCKYCGAVVAANSMGCKFSPNRKHET